MKPINKLILATAADVLPKIKVKIKKSVVLGYGIEGGRFRITADHVPGSKLGPMTIKCLVQGLRGYEKMVDGYRASFEEGWGGVILNGRAYSLPEFEKDQIIDSALQPNGNTLTLEFKVGR